MKVLVLGAGISGLSCGILLLQKGYGAGFTLSWGCAQEVVDLVHNVKS